MKRKIKQSFDLGSVTYDKFSEVQKEVGQLLLDFFEKIESFAQEAFRNILELCPVLV